MKLKKNLAYLLLCCALGTTAMSCSKEKVEVEVPEAVDPRIDPEKLKRIERFMMIVFGIAADTKKYDADKEIFYVHETTVTRVEMEKLYDTANEYKSKYEKN